MFESLVATILNRFLGSYVQNFDPKQLNIGIWSGDAKLSGLVLKKETLDALQLPLEVILGHIGELTLQIPWSNLKSKPVKVVIEDVYLLLLPTMDKSFDPQEQNDREQRVKQEMLKNLETMNKAAAENLDIASDPKNESFAESLITKIVDNLQITIRNIHIRYQDELALAESPYAFGFSLKELLAVSTDSAWSPSFISLTEAFTRKLLTLDSLSCYMNTDSPALDADADANEGALLLTALKHAVNSPLNLQYLLKPVSGTGKLTIQKHGSTSDHPHIKADMNFKEFSLELDSDQYRNALWTASKFHWYMKTQKFRCNRPKETIEQDPRAWFRYAARLVLDEIHEKNYRWSWAYFAKRRDQRKAYITLWIQSLAHDGVLTAPDSLALKDLEEALSFEDIKFYRSLARSEWRKEQILAPKPADSVSQSNAATGGWFSYIWGSSPQPPTGESGADSGDESADLVENDMKLSDDQRKALYDAIDYDDEQSIMEAVDVPRDQVQYEISTFLEKGGFSIKKDRSSPNLAEVVFEGCTTNIYARPDSTLAKFQLQEFRVEDGTGSTIYKHIVSVKHLHTHLTDVADEEDPFFQVSFEQNPLDGSADSILLARLRSMTIFYNVKFVEQVMLFFTPPKIHLDTVGAIMNAAEATMEGISEQTRIGLQYALEEHKTVNVKLDLQAPLFILPLDPASYKSPVAILDAGHISVISDLVEKSKIEEIKAKESYSASDWDRLQSLMYDKFSLILQDMQFLTGKDIKSTMEQLHNENEDRPALMLDKLSVNLLMGISIMPHAYNLPKFTLGGDVPQIRLAMSDFQYKLVMQIIDASIPLWMATDAEDSSVFHALATQDQLSIADDNTLLSSDLGSKNGANDSVAAEAMKKQRLFDFQLNVKSVVLTLARCTNELSYMSDPLIELNCKAVLIHLFMTQCDLGLNLSLSNMDVFDHMQKPTLSGYPLLISSSDDHHLGVSAKKLLVVDYARSQRIATHHGTEIEVFDQDIKIDFATMRIVLARTSWMNLYNFILSTFTDPNAESTPADVLNHNSPVSEDAAPQKIALDVNLDSVIVEMVEDSTKLATLTLSTASVQLVLLPEEMDVSGTLGALTLIDDQGDGRFKNLISIEGNKLVQFEYRTFDPITNHNCYDSFLKFRVGSLNVNFVETVFTKIATFLNRFLEMKVIYDTARLATINQVNQLEESSRMKFDIVVQAPIVVLQRPGSLDGPNVETITARLGELYGSNSFDGADTNSKNLIQLGIRNVALTSDFLLSDGKKQVSDIIKDVDVSIRVVYDDQCTDVQLPTFKVSGGMSDVDVRISELQIKFFMQLVASFSSEVDSDISEPDITEIKEEAANVNAVVKRNSSPQPLTVEKTQQTDEKRDSEDGERQLLNVEFEAPRFALTLYDDTKKSVNIENQAIVCFALRKAGLSLVMKNNGDYNAHLQLGSVSMEDMRVSTATKFRELIIPSSGTGNQFAVSAACEVTPERKVTSVIVTADNPCLVVALDHVLAMQQFMTNSFTNEEVSTDPQRSSSAYSTASNNRSIQASSPSLDESSATSNVFGLSVHIKEPTVMLLQDPTQADTLAAVLKVEQVSFNSQDSMSFAVNNAGLYLSRMTDSHNASYKIVDDFSMSCLHDGVNVEASVDPILVRVSLRDIRLALAIFNGATEMFSSDSDITEESESSLAAQRPSLGGSSISGHGKAVRSKSSSNFVIEKSNDSKINDVVNETMNLASGGLRLVLIGEIHELPVLDMQVRPFELKARNWSSNFSAEVHLDQCINIYNYARSTWEPLLEPWQVSVFATRTISPREQLTVNFVSHKVAEFTVTSRLVALLSLVSELLHTAEDLKPRGEDNPYVIVNMTGLDIEVWADNDSGGTKYPIKKNQQIPWLFEDWKQVRENLLSDTKAGVLGVSFTDKVYNDIGQILITGEGEELFMLTPPRDGVHSRLLCDVVLNEDNIKTVTLRSSIKIENDANIAIMMMVTDNTAGDEATSILIEAKATQSIPIALAYGGKFRIMPRVDQAFDYSTEAIGWLDLLYGNHALLCPTVDKADKSSCHFQVAAKYDHNEPLAKVYPHMNLVISAPLQIENLLPFDLKYRLYDKRLLRDWSGSIAHGVNEHVNVVSLFGLLLLSIEPLNCGFGQSEFAIINTSTDAEFSREDTLSLRHENGQKLKLRIHYPKLTSDSASLRVVIYSPYVVINSTGRDLFVSEKGNQMKSVGDGLLSGHQPCMFSFEKFGDRRNRAAIKVGNTGWSQQLSFDAIGQAVEVKAPVPGKSAEVNMGIAIADGQGKFAHTKVITLTPRFMIRNLLKEPIEICESGTNKSMVIDSQKVQPIYEMRASHAKNLMIKLHEDCPKWTLPFSVNNIGKVFLKVYKINVGLVLLEVNIMLDEATIFVLIKDAGDNWPFSIRNFSSTEFQVFQGDPNVDENREVVRSDIEYKPIFYKIPPRSSMPYAYDYPNAVTNTLVIRCQGKTRTVNLAEIGNLQPFKLPPGPQGELKILDINVVADGPTQCLVISDYDSSLSLYKIKDEAASSTTSVSQTFQVSESDENYYTRFVTKFEGFGISLINLKAREVCYITLRGLEVRYNESDLYQNLSVKLKWIQIDNQLFGGLFPIVLYPSVVPKSGKEMNSHPSISASVSKVKDDGHGVLILKYATILLQTMSIEVDEDFLYAFLDFIKFPGASWNQQQVDKLCESEISLPEPKQEADAPDVYFEALLLQPILLNLSFARTDRFDEDEVPSPENALMLFFNILTMAIGNINDAPIQLNLLFIENMRAAIPTLVETIAAHYSQAFLYQMHRILGSADFLGDPVGLFKNLSSGVLDIFYEPYQGFVMNDSPQELGISIAKGGLSFLKKSIFGFSDSLAKMTGSFAKGLSVATLDKKYQERRWMARRNKPRHALNGVASGANSFYESLASGISGIATAPIEGAASGGAAGFFRGLGKGVVGFPTKTAIGFFDLASNVSEGIRNTTTAFDGEGLERARLPRCVPVDMIIRPFSEREAQGQYWLKAVDEGAFFNDRYVAHLVLTGETNVIAVTFLRIVLFDIESLVSKWIVAFKNVSSISQEPNGVTIALQKGRDRFVPIPRKDQRHFLYQHISFAVREFNKNCLITL